MRTLFLLLFLMSTSSVDARPVPEIRANIEGLAPACSTGAVSLGSPHLGKLEFGDCTLDDGQYVDYLQFNGQRGDLVLIELRPLSEQFTQPFLALLPPPGDPSNPPAMLNGEALEIAYILSTDGPWKIAVTSFDGAGRGEYLVLVERLRSGLPLEERDCIAQYIRCGQVLFGALTPESCRFVNSSEIYQGAGIYMQQHRRTSFKLYSEDFAPVVSVWDGEEGEYIGEAGFADRYETATATVSAPRDDYYQITITRDDSRLGDYLLEANCGYRACVWPIIIGAPQPTTVRPGESATLAATAHGTSITYRWYEASGPRRTLVHEGQSFTTPPMFEDQDFVVEAENECGSWDVRVKVTVEELRRRTVRRP